MKHTILVIALSLLSFSNINCEGGNCGSIIETMVDIDNDCIDDTIDNCVGIYNPDQTDGDGDGVGFDCDSNDSDNTVTALLKDDYDDEMVEQFEDEAEYYSDKNLDDDIYTDDFEDTL